MASYTINACGLQCPAPIMHLFNQMQKAHPGDLVTIEANDMGFKKDVEAWCRKTKNELVSLREEAGIITAQICKV